MICTPRASGRTLHTYANAHTALTRLAPDASEEVRHMSNNAYWLSKAVTRSTLVVPTHGFGMGDVCPQAAGSSAVTTMRKRHLDAIQATPATGPTPWSPPVT
jgi:hypothetical protein